MECYRKHFFDMEKEEKWLNEMAEKGLALKEVKSGFLTEKYCFEESSAKYTYRVDYSRDGAVMEEITAPYVMFVTSSCGAEYLCWANGRVYFRKDKEKGEFPPLYSEAKSRYETELRQFGGSVGIMSLLLFDVVYCGYSAIEKFLAVGVNWFSVLEAVCVLICAAFLAIFARKAIGSCKKMSELKKIMKE